VKKVKGLTIFTPKISPKHNDSFWYEGLIAEYEKGNIHRKMYANGEIRIYNKNNEIVFDTKERGDGFPELPNGLQNDDDLFKLEELGYYWDMNNWFSIEEDDEGNWCEIDIPDTYDGAIKILIEGGG
jgi:hypothetical protein